MCITIWTAALSIIAYLCHRRAWRAVMSKPRRAVDTGDLVAAGVFLFGAAFLVVFFALITWRKGTPQEWWPLVAIAVSGLTLESVSSALGLSPRPPGRVV